MDSASIKQKANRLYSSGLFQDALTEYSLAIDLDGGNHVLYSNRAQTFIKLKRWNDALQDCHVCLSLKPDFVKGLYRRAVVLIQLNRYQESEKDLELALKVEPNNKLLRDELLKLKLLQQKPSSSRSIETKAPTQSPISSYQFQVQWRDLGSSHDNKIKYRSSLLSLMDQKGCLGFIAGSLEPSLMSEIIEVISSQELPESLAQKVIDELKSSPQFELNQMLLENHEKEVLDRYLESTAMDDQ